MGIFTWLQYKQIGRLTEIITKGQATPVVKPHPSAPNQVLKEDPDVIEFSEESPLNIPSDVKLEIEGGDSVVPPGFKEVAENDAKI